MKKLNENEMLNIVGGAGSDGDCENCPLKGTFLCNNDCE